MHKNKMNFKSYMRKRTFVMQAEVNGKEAFDAMVNGIDGIPVSFAEDDKKIISQKKDCDTTVGFIATDEKNFWFVNAEFFSKNYASNDYPFGFGEAISLMRNGHAVQRAGWNGKGMFIFMVPGKGILETDCQVVKNIFGEKPVIYEPHITMKTADDKMVPWLASQTDILAQDWQIFKMEEK